MPKLKKREVKEVKVKKPKEVVEELIVEVEEVVEVEETPEVTPEVKPEVPIKIWRQSPVENKLVENKLPIYDNKQVSKVLEDGHTKTHFNCLGKDSKGNVVTFHVPKNLF